MSSPGYLCLAAASGALALGACVAQDPDRDVYGHAFTITIASATIAPTEPDGTQWDSDNSAPDPYAKVFYNDKQITTTPTISESFDATWDDALPPFTINRGDVLRVDLYDSDPIGDGDMILSCPGGNVEIPADALRAGEIQCSDAGSHLIVNFDELPSV